MPAVIKHYPNAKFVVSGKGQSTEMAKLNAHAEHLGVKDNIIFTGYYPDSKLPLLYQAGVVFAFSTFYEHHPFAVLEALSSGLPVVTTDVGGIPETIQNGKNGYMVKPFDSNAFSEKILHLLDHPTFAKEMGAQARETIVKGYDWQILVKEAMKVYDEALN
jgi:glycosyltransferase involved in cell wall biosynthesis